MEVLRILIGSRTDPVMALQVEINPMDNQPASTAFPTTIRHLQDQASAAFAMLAGMQLEVFTQLADGPRDATGIAAAIGVADDRLSRLLYALVIAGLLECHGHTFANTPEAAAFLVKGRPGYLGSIHSMLQPIWHADIQTAHSIRSGGPADLHDYNNSSDADLSSLLRGLHGTAVATARDFMQRFDFSGCHSLIDVGGGSGGLVATFCDARPDLEGTLFDLPRTVALAAPILAETPGGNRVIIESGDILAAPPRGMHDVAVMRAFVQVFSPGDAARAIVNTAAAVRPGGKIYISGAGILDNDRLGPRPAVFYNVTFMNFYNAGASYTEAEHAAWLAAAGCADVGRITMANGLGIIHATKIT